MDNIDLDFSNLSRRQVIDKYLENMRQFKILAEKKYHISSHQFDNYILNQYFPEMNKSFENGCKNQDGAAGLSTTGTSYFKKTSTTSNYYNHIEFVKNEILRRIIDRKRKILYWLFYLTIVYLLIAYKNEASSLVLRNVQSYVYPGMKMWRKITLPIIKMFPSLTELYDESCLIINPFFQVNDLDCEPCANIMNVLEFSNVNNLKKQLTESVPFVFKMKQDIIEIEEFNELYTKNRDIFKRDAYRVKSTNNEITNLEELFKDFNKTLTPNQKQSHSLHRCNRMEPARKIRQLFGRTNRLPNTGVALERFISIDTPKAPSYKLPDAECANIYVQQASGARFIILRPTPECHHKCRSLSIRLPSGYLLSYNWWYWKPISAADPMTDTPSLSLIGSYC